MAVGSHKGKVFIYRPDQNGKVGLIIAVIVAIIRVIIRIILIIITVAFNSALVIIHFPHISMELLKNMSALSKEILKSLIIFVYYVLNFSFNKYV